MIFDTGTIKLADFGLSKSLPVNKHAGYDLDSKFKLTGETGSYRYMAPEVFRHEPYNFKVCFNPVIIATAFKVDTLHQDRRVLAAQWHLQMLLDTRETNMGGSPQPRHVKAEHGLRELPVMCAATQG